MKKKLPYDAAAYQKRVNECAPRSRTALMCLRAFWTGGLICCLGQAIHDLMAYFLPLTQGELASATSIVMIFLAGLLTGIGVYDRIGAYAGAGSVVPITGFANSVVAPAIEFKPEGFVMGVAAKMFNLAGPVLVYGISASIVVGIIYYIILGG